MYSLSGRLLLFVSLLLAVFFGLTIFVLDLSFRDLSSRSLRDVLDAQLIGIVAASEPDDFGSVKPLRPLVEPRFAQPGSGLYAQIRTLDGEMLWRSQSALGTNIEFSDAVTPGKKQLDRRIAGDSELMVLSAGFNWEIRPGADRDLVFSVAEDLAPYEAQLQRFRNQLFGWFAALSASFLVVLAFLLRRVLSPLRRIEHEIGEVEAGGRDQLGTALPRELAGLATNMNTLLASERKRVERYRNTLGDLAHSLKTPLAVIRTSLSGQTDAATRDATINQQIDRMDTIVQHQLSRATVSSTALLGRTVVEVEPVLQELRGALSKVYARKDLSIELKTTPGAAFSGERGDLLELAGNLMDNACKWCRHRVRVTAERLTAPSGARLKLTIEDDGTGIDESQRGRILERGARLDERTSGQGIGLAMVREIVELYGGRIAIGDSTLGGAQFVLTF